VLALLPAARAHTPYGMTEVLPVTDIELTERELIGDGEGVCVGRPVEAVEVCISPLDTRGVATGSPTDAPGVTGEILVRAPWAKDRYDRLAATQAASTEVGGWHRSGDVGHLDDQGRLWVEGRLAHVISTSNGALTPVGLEQRVETLPEVAAAACVGVGPPGTQVVVVVVVPTRRPRRRQRLADPDLAARVRTAALTEVAAVLVRESLPVDVRHNSKVDRTALSLWAAGVLS
jgi:acyl-coenzyme A synthetase/AMP-(fatty) acid ligase